jgi:hypothetical protein
MKLTKEQVKEAVATIYGLLCSGKDDTEILDEMGIGVEEFEKLKAAMFDVKADEVRAKPTEHTYVQYMIDQMRNLSDLDDMIESFKTTKQYNAMVGAVRARSEILDKLIAKGQEFGLIHKMPDKKEIVAGILVADLTNKELKKMITRELTNLNGMMRRYGDRNIMDIEPGAIHRGEALPAAVLGDSSDTDSTTKKKKATSKTVKANTAKRTAGRKVVRSKSK